MLQKTFEGWNLRRFVRIQYICLCTIRNVIKRDRKNGVQDESTPTVKKAKKQTVLLSHYPLTSALAENLVEVAEDSRSLEEHIR